MMQEREREKETGRKSKRTGGKGKVSVDLTRMLIGILILVAKILFLSFFEHKCLCGNRFV